MTWTKNPCYGTRIAAFGLLEFYLIGHVLPRRLDLGRVTEYGIEDDTLYMLRSLLASFTTFVQFRFQKSFTRFDDFAQSVKFFIASRSVRVIFVTLSLIAALLSNKCSFNKCIFK